LNRSVEIDDNETVDSLKAIIEVEVFYELINVAFHSLPNVDDQVLRQSGE